MNFIKLMPSSILLILILLFIGESNPVHAQTPNDKDLDDPRVSDVREIVLNEVFHRDLRNALLKFCDAVDRYRPTKSIAADEAKILEICLHSRGLYLEAKRYGEFYPSDMWVNEVKPLVVVLYEIALQKIEWVSLTDNPETSPFKAYGSISDRLELLVQFQGSQIAKN